MGQQHKDKQPEEPVEVTQEDVDKSIQSSIDAGKLSPQSSELLKGQSLNGTPVRMLIGGHMTTVFLTDFDLPSNSYHGIAIRSFSMNSGENPPILSAVHGARQYPTTDRPNYSFQFVLPGEDESVLINIAQQNIVDRHS